MFFAGIETTGNAIGFLLYNLSVNEVILKMFNSILKELSTHLCDLKEKQEKLRRELSSLPKRLRPADVDKMKYLKACIKESFRTLPTVRSLWDGSMWQFMVLSI